MALVRNIAGFNSVGAEGGGQTALLQNIVKFSEAAKEKGGSAVAASDPLVMAVKMGINLIPEGNFKKWVTMNPFQLYKKLWQAIFGKRFTTGQYRLGERLLDQIDPTGTANNAVSYRDVPDEVVENAMLLFTLFFGVRITTQEDLDALQIGSSAYYSRPDKKDIPQHAVDRAVFLKQTYFPDSSYNVRKWDTDIFSQFPLVAPIPDPFHYGQLYTGPIPGGGNVTNGVVEIDEIPGITNPGSTSGAVASSNNLVLWLGLALLGYGVYKYSKQNR